MISDGMHRKLLQWANRLLSERPQPEPSLFINMEPLRAGTQLGPRLQGITTESDCVLIFCDDGPRTNFAHHCRYFLFDSRSADLLRIHEARFPPYTRGTPPSYRWLAGWRPGEIRLRVERLPPYPSVPRDITRRGRRFAVLFCGCDEASGLNDMEFSYRLLTQQYGWKAADIFALYFNGQMSVPTTNWPADATPYQIASNVNGIREGTRGAMQTALSEIKARLTTEDLLFIHTTGHGEGTGGGSTYILTPDKVQETYTAYKFGKDLANLADPAGARFRNLIVMMAQCCSGGFRSKVVNSGCADNISFAAAAKSTQLSYKTDDLLWNRFARDWLAAQHGLYPDGVTNLTKPADTGPGGAPDLRISADEAYTYANDARLANPAWVTMGEVDTPVSGFEPAAAREIHLD